MVNRWTARLLLWRSTLIGILICLVLSLAIGRPLFEQWIVEKMAYDLAPRNYPQAKLINQNEGGGPTSAWDRRTYQTPDDINKVLTFLQSQTQLEFHQRERADVNGPFYESYFCNKSQQAIDITRALVGGHYPWYAKDENLPIPCASIFVYSDSNKPGLTFIEVWIEWPAM